MDMSLAPYATREVPSSKPVVGVLEHPARHTNALVTGGVLRQFSVPETDAGSGVPRAGNDHFHRRHRALAATGVHPGQEVARAVPELGREGRPVDHDRALAVAYGTHLRVLGDGRS